MFRLLLSFLFKWLLLLNFTLYLESATNTWLGALSLLWDKYWCPL